MATTAPPYTPLAPEQRRLLLAALSSYRKNSGAQSQQASPSPGAESASAPPNNAMSATDGVSPSVLSNATQGAATDAAASLDFTSFDNTFNFDLDDASPNGRNSMDDGLAGLGSLDSDQQGEKRKSPGDDDSLDGEDDTDPKRHEGEEKGSKKPGRKPLTSEPTTKRKAQNRAAQRAFRERKEKHLKDLETKVADLEKASESANHENSILRAQVERLQEEMREYKRRHSINGAPLGGSPPAARPSMSSHRQSSGNSIDDFDFSFDFSRFNESDAAKVSPQTSMSQGSMSSIQRQPSKGTNDALGSMFGTGFFDGIGGANKNTSASPQTFSSSNDSPSAFNWASPANSNSTSSRSPSTSNQNVANSSCCTSPDETNWALNYNKTGNDNTFSLINTPSLLNAKTPDSTSGNAQKNTSTNNALDWLSTQNGGMFDPVLFGDYRESQDNVVGNGDFTGGFFEEGLPFPDFNDPFNFNTSTDTTVPAPVIAPSSGLMGHEPTKPDLQKGSLLEKVAAQRDGGAEYDESLVMPGETDKKQDTSLMACYKIWNTLQNCPRFHSGDFDIDNLCSELASKATCTETGLAIEKDKVEAALWKLASDGGSPMGANPTA